MASPDDDQRTKCIKTIIPEDEQMSDVTREQAQKDLHEEYEKGKAEGLIGDGMEAAFELEVDDELNEGSITPEEVEKGVAILRQDREEIEGSQADSVETRGDAMSDDDVEDLIEELEADLGISEQDVENNDVLEDLAAESRDKAQAEADARDVFGA